MKQLTVKEALEQGYTNFVYEGEGYQTLQDISDISERDFKKGVELVSKEPHPPAGMSKEDIAETLAEQIYCQHSDETGDDTDNVYEAIKAIDFSDVEKKIEDALAGLKFYSSTGIKLVP